MNVRDNQVAIRVRNLRKSFDLTDPEMGRVTARLIHPIRGSARSTLPVLDGLSFDVMKGEVFGVTGSNGAGKTTLLRLITGIYEPDSGSIEVAGRVAPFLELGIGFQADLTARQNVMINGVLLGVPRREMRRRLDQILEFAELARFADMQLKNFSSGMRVRLAFSIIVVAAAADVIIMDEVLTVGDASFQQRCREAFDRLRGEGKSIVLVTHRQLEEFCDRAMLLHRGHVVAIGDPADVARRYRTLREAQRAGIESEEEGQYGMSTTLRAARRMRASITRLVIGGGAENGSRLQSGQPIRVELTVDVDYRITRPRLAIEINGADGVEILGSHSEKLGVEGPLLVRRDIILSGRIENALPPGDYVLKCALVQLVQGTRLARVSPSKTVRFAVGAADDGSGSPGAPQTELEFVPEPADVPARPDMRR